MVIIVLNLLMTETSIHGWSKHFPIKQDLAYYYTSKMKASYIFPNKGIQRFCVFYFIFKHHVVNIIGQL